MLSEFQPQSENELRLVEMAHQAFQSRFNRKPELGAIAPGRVNLIGEHTDYNGGYVLPLAINRHTVVLASRSNANVSRLWAHDLRQEESTDFSRPLKRIGNSFADYIYGVVHQFQSTGSEIENLDLLVMGDLPRGAGLSSSASLEVATATLLAEITGRRLPPLDLARLCQRAECEFVGMPCGIMDMLIIAAGQENAALLIDCENLQTENVPLPDPNQATLLIIDTGVERKLVSSEYATRRQACESAAGKIGLQSLRHASIDVVNKTEKLSNDERRKALHVVQENQRVLAAVEALKCKDLEMLGQLMFESHASLRNLFEVSTPELDMIVDIADSMRQQDGSVLGARMTGAGFGGCAIMLCRGDQAKCAARRLGHEYGSHARRIPAVIATKAVNGVQRLRTTDTA